MQITSIQLKNFRCFSNQTFDCDNRYVLISGNNGSGKSSLLEALHYSCYLRSFRTHLPKELIHFDEKTLFIKLALEHESQAHEISIGFSGDKRLVKKDQTAIQSYKELTDYYRVITITEHDLALIQGSPEVRRLFLDQVLAIHNPDYVAAARSYRKILAQRNALLTRDRINHEMYDLWTRQLFDQAQIIQHARAELLAKIAHETRLLLAEWFSPDMSIAMQYKPKNSGLGQSYELFRAQQPNLMAQEQRFRRTLFGPHLDDVLFTFCERSSRIFASRGQQKLLLLLTKIAQAKILAGNNGYPILLLDDFMTDLDPDRAERLLEILANLSTQIIATSPTKASHFDRLLLERYSARHIKLTI